MHCFKFGNPRNKFCDQTLGLQHAIIRSQVHEKLREKGTFESVVTLVVISLKLINILEMREISVVV